MLHWILALSWALIGQAVSWHFRLVVTAGMGLFVHLSLCSSFCLSHFCSYHMFPDKSMRGWIWNLVDTRPENFFITLHWITTVSWMLIGWTVSTHWQTNHLSDWAQIWWANALWTSPDWLTFGHHVLLNLSSDLKTLKCHLQNDSSLSLPHCVMRSPRFVYLSVYSACYKQSPISPGGTVWVRTHIVSHIRWGWSAMRSQSMQVSSGKENRFLYQWLCARLQYLQCVRNGDIAVFHKSIAMS